MSKGWEWCKVHQRFEDAGDFIDFPCSEDWLDFYHEQGLTPRRSPYYFARHVEEALRRVVGARSTLEELNERLTKIEKMLAVDKMPMPKREVKKEPRESIKSPRTKEI